MSPANNDAQTAALVRQYTACRASLEAQRELLRAFSEAMGRLVEPLRNDPLDLDPTGETILVNRLRRQTNALRDASLGDKTLREAIQDYRQSRAQHEQLERRMKSHGLDGLVQPPP